MNKIGWILLGSVLAFGIFKLMKFDSALRIAESKAEDICARFRLGDPHDYVFDVMTDDIKNENNAEVVRQTNQEFLTTVFYGMSINQRYICTTKFENGILVEKFTKFLD